MFARRKRNDEALAERVNWAAVLTTIGVIVVLCGLFYFLSHRQANTDYEGRIIDRWAGYSEGEEGSRPYFRLRAQSDSGKEFVVRVEPNIYESARVGMRIRSKSGQVVLVESDERPAGK